MTAAVAIRVLIADDHPIVREGLRWLIDGDPGMEVVGEAADGAEAVRYALSLRPDVLVLDLRMPAKDGIQAIEEIREQHPDARILVVTGCSEDEMVLAAVRAGALGYVLKDTRPRDLLDAIRTVARGELSLGPMVAHRLVRELNRPPEPARGEEALTEREAGILGLIARGLSNQQIAARLMISERTVRGHVSNILAKLHLDSRTQAAVYALEAGFPQKEQKWPTPSEVCRSWSARYLPQAIPALGRLGH